MAFVLENHGPGYARDVHCVISTDGAVEVKNPEAYLGNLGVGSIAVEFTVEVMSGQQSIYVDVAWHWKNFDGSNGAESSLFELEGQPGGINWDSLALEEPYKLEPVTTEDELVGRTEILNQLTAKAKATSVGSACIWGQRRVGKTSIAKTLKTRLLGDQSLPFVVLFLEAGEYVHPDPARSIEQLGTKICRQLILSDKRLSHLHPPRFSGALSPLSDFIDEVTSVAPDLRIIIILDEFDNVPLDLYRRGPAGEAFFSTIRSLSHKTSVGFVLVGGERMRHVFDCQGQTLNKFHMIRVDYFDRERHWADFRDLVTRPSKAFLQFSDSALVRIYAEAAGNPYYTVLLCRTLFNIMVSRRDCHVTVKEADEAVAKAIQEASIVNFQHFWDDSIIETGGKAEDVSMRRRFVLLALAESMHRSNLATRADVSLAGQKYGLDCRSVENELSEFVQREVMVEQAATVACKVPLFAGWLRTVGPRQISTTYTEAESIRIIREEEERAAVTSTEIVSLVHRWPAYKGRRLTADEVRAWLDQFRKNSDQRLMFRLLQHIRFYSEDVIRNQMGVAHGIVTRGLVDKRAHKQVKRWPDVLVSYLDGPGKSGARFANLYIDENEMYNESLVERGHLKDALGRNGVEALVFVDDFIGTGMGASENLKTLFRECGQELSTKKVRVFLVAVSGFADGRDSVQSFIEESKIPARIHLCDTLDDTHVCFNPKSAAFPSAVERERAKEIAEQIGAKICKPAPLGFNNSQALVVFSHNCPNNSLPILWEKTKDWNPLFRRD